MCNKTHAHTHTHAHTNAHTHSAYLKLKKNIKVKVQILASQMTRFRILSKFISMYCVFLICKQLAGIPLTGSYCLLPEQVTLPTYPNILYFLLSCSLQWNSDAASYAIKPSSVVLTSLSLHPGYHTASYCGDQLDPSCVLLSL